MYCASSYRSSTSSTSSSGTESRARRTRMAFGCSFRLSSDGLPTSCSMGYVGYADFHRCFAAGTTCCGYSLMRVKVPGRLLGTFPSSTLPQEGTGYFVMSIRLPSYSCLMMFFVPSLVYPFMSGSSVVSTVPRAILLYTLFVGSRIFHSRPDWCVWFVWMSLCITQSVPPVIPVFVDV